MDKYQVKLPPNADGEILGEEEFLALAAEAGWSSDPGTGKAVLLPDERGAPGHEVLNPIPFAPPIGWEPTPPIEQLIRERVKAEVDRLEEDEAIDDIVDAEDFDIPDELPELSTIYEVMGMDEEVPAVPKDAKVDAEQRARDELDFEELKFRERKLRERRSREEYSRRQAEHEELYGPSERVREALQRRGEEEGGQ